MSLNSLPVINFQADIHEDSANQLVYYTTQIQRAGLQKIVILLNSRGGLVQQGLSLFNYLRSLPLTIETHNIGMVDSMANALYLAGDIRNASGNSRFLLHGVTRSGRFTEEELVRALDAVRHDNEIVARTIAGRTKYTVAALKGIFKGETILSPEEAIEHGIAHEIREFEMPKGAELISILNKPGS